MRSGKSISWSFVLIGALLVGVLWWLKGVHNTNKIVSDDQAAPSKNQTPARIVADETMQVLSETLTLTGRVYVASRGGITKTATVPQSWQLTAEQLETMLFEDNERVEPAPRSAATRNQDLTFFGVALDEKTNAVANARVEADVMVGRPNQSLKRETFRANTDATGRFELRVEWGQQMMVTVTGSTNEYINPEPQWFQYGPVGNQPIHRPDHLKPVVFRFQTRQASVPLFEFTKGQYIPNDGTPVRVDLTTGELVPKGGDLIVTLHALEPYTNLKPFPWHVGVQVVDGGIQKTGGLGTRMENLHEAPVDGYDVGFFIEYGPDSPSYRRQHDGWYYVRSRNGQVHAKLFFSCNPSWDERGIPFGIRAVVNTNGSRYLHTEPK